MSSLRTLLLSVALMAFLTTGGGAPRALHGPSTKRKAKSLPAAKEQPVRGIAFHLCSCSLPCSCLFNGNNVAGCNVVKVYHYTAGGYLGKQIVNQTIVIVPHPEALQKAKDTPRTEGEPVASVIYLPPGLTEEQEGDLITPLMEMDMIFGFQKFIKRRAKITFRSTATGYEVEIPGIFHAITEKLLGPNKKQITADNLSAAEGTRWFFGKTRLHTYQDSEQPA